MRIIALIAAYNEGDVIYHVLGDLIANGILVYFIDNNSTDNTVEEASKWLGRGLLHIERFPQDCGYPEHCVHEYVWRDILRRKEELALSLNADWYIHSDADEFRESPWSGVSLKDGIEKVDAMGFTAIDFELLNFRPTDDNFVPGTDVRSSLIYYDGFEEFDAKQIKAWKNLKKHVDVVTSGGHDIEFTGRHIFPVKFILRHYPIRSQEHGLKKVFQERKKRFNQRERDDKWHIQYDTVVDSEHNFIRQKKDLVLYDPEKIRNKLITGFPQFVDYEKCRHLNSTYVSIIIPVFNQLRYTAKCLEVLYAVTSDTINFEVIVVDNASTDETPAFLQQATAHYPNLRVIRNKSNLLFARACNLGAEAAAGELLVFLNNDTEPLQGWLENGLNRLLSNPEIGIVGAKLLYPDGKIQHCGIEFFARPELPAPRHFWPLHRFLNVAGDDPCVNISEEVALVTGACLFISKKLFNDIGGFSPDYGMYFEDADLCMAVRRTGRKIWYEPTSVLIHHESKSSPRSREHIDELNRTASTIFYERWHLEIRELAYKNLIDRTDGKYVYFKNTIVPCEATNKTALELAVKLSLLPSFFLHFGGSGDALLLMASMPLDRPGNVIISIANSIASMRVFFDVFPNIERVYFIPHPETIKLIPEQIRGGVHYLLRNIIPQLQNCLGHGVTPTGNYDDEWNERLDPFAAYGMEKLPVWVNTFNKIKLCSPQILLAPKGSSTFHYRTKRNIVAPHFWLPLLSFFREMGISPIVIGTPDENIAYPIDDNCVDRRSYSFADQMNLIASSNLLIGADSWHKTFASLAGVQSIVFQAIAGEDLKNWKDSSEYVFVDPWENICLVRSMGEFTAAYAEYDKYGRILNRNLTPPQSQLPQRFLSSFSPCFWERNYDSVKNVLIRCTPAIGDALYLTAIAAEVKRQYPHLKIYISGDERVEWVFRHHPAIESHVKIHSNEELALEATIDITIEYNHILDRFFEYHNGIGFFDMLANVAGIHLNDRQMIYTVKPDEAIWAEQELQNFAGTNVLIGLQFFTNKDIRRSYPHGVKLVRRLRECYPQSRFILFGQEPLGEENLAVYDCAERQTSFRRQMALARLCDAFITIDSAFFHVGHNLCHKPTLIIAGLTNPQLIGVPEFGTFMPVTNEYLSCLACYWQKQCSIECMLDLAPDIIVAAFAKLLNDPANCRDWQRTLPCRELTLTPLLTIEEQLVINLIEPGCPFRLTLKTLHDVRLPEYARQWNGVTIEQTMLQSDYFDNTFLFNKKTEPPTPFSERLNIAWYGPQFIHHSLALVNRELCLQLHAAGHQLSLHLINDTGTCLAETRLQPLLKLIDASLPKPVDVNVYHWYPPNLTPPSDGHWVMIQPWEMGSVPKQWIEVMNDMVDEVWVPTSYVRDCYINSGMNPNQIAVVPNGIDTELFSPTAMAYQLSTRKRFRFLYVGSTTLERKGFDILISAYTQEFFGVADVCLVVKDMAIYTGGVNPIRKQIADLCRQPGIPEILFMDKDLSSLEQAGIYAACTCFVHSYRAEGFSLPVAEAMACGLPVIVTGHGACLDFCDDANAYLIPAREVRLAEKQVYGWDTVDHPWWAEPDPRATRSLMRFVYEHPEEAKVKGRVARERIVRGFTWKHAGIAAEKRLEIITSQPILRFHKIPKTPCVNLAPVSQRSFSLLFIAPILPTFDRDSGSFRLYQLLKILREEGHQITFLAQGGAGNFDHRPYQDALESLGIEVLPFDPERLEERTGIRINAPLVDLKELLATRRFDVSYIYFYFTAAYYLNWLREYSPNTKIIIDSVDFHYLRERRAAELARDADALHRAERTLQNELFLYEQADLVIMVTEEDRRAVQGYSAKIKAEVIPNIHPSGDDPAPYTARSGIMFVGNFFHTPNPDAVLYLVNEIMPLVRKRLPHIMLTIVGNSPPPEIQVLADRYTRVTGYVEDLGPLLDSHLISVAPLRFGAGMKGKVGEAMAAGLPVVISEVAAEGCGFRNGEDILMARNSAEFADMIITLYTNESLWTQLSRNGRRTVQEKFSPDVLRDSIRAILLHTLKDTLKCRTSSKPKDSVALEVSGGIFESTGPVINSVRYPLIPLVEKSASSILQKLSSSQRTKSVLKQYTVND